MRESSREARVADFVRDEVAQIMRNEMRDPRVSFVSVNDVRVSRDLSYADIYVSSFDVASEDERVELLAVLNGASGFFRSLLAKRHSMRTTPKPRFHYDALIEGGPKMEALIEKALESDREQGQADPRVGPSGEQDS